MKFRNVLFGATLVIATATITTSVVSQQDKGKTGGKDMNQGMPPEVKEMIDKCTAAGTPGENHKLLDGHVGKWNAVVKMWMTPDMPAPQESTCTSEGKWIYGNRYLQETVEGSFEGETFLGQSITGYDNIKKKYVSFWISNMDTGFFTGEGSFDSGAKTFKYTTSMSCPLAEKTVNGRTVEKWTDKDHFVVEMYGPWYKTGKEYKTMEIAYTRAK